VIYLTMTMKAEEIEIPFGQQACVGARNHVGGHIGAITANSDLPDDDDGARHYVRLPYRARAEPAPPRLTSGQHRTGSTGMAADRQQRTGGGVCTGLGAEADV